ncbi:MAG: phBC6A51 family helix-turn-helix protein [Desulfitobacterium sp.]
MKRGQPVKLRENQKQKVKQSKEWVPNARQIKMAELLLNPEDRRTKQAKCEEVGITPKTLWKWMQDKRYIDYLNGLLDEVTSTELTDVWKALILQCKRGNIQAIKLFFELKELHPVIKDQKRMSEEKLQLERERFEHQKKMDEMKGW